VSKKIDVQKFQVQVQSSCTLNKIPMLPKRQLDLENFKVRTEFDGNLAKSRSSALLPLETSQDAAAQSRVATPPTATTLTSPETTRQTSPTGSREAIRDRFYKTSFQPKTLL
jgi:hypothetical protein